jgi:hypothetical protein
MFLLVIGAWITLINIALDNPVEQIEIEKGAESGSRHETGSDK